MTRLTIGSLCSGYGGFDCAVEQFFDAETRWFCEFEAAPSKVLAAHWPNVPNHGDMTKIEWSAVEPVDIIAGGTPCQDLSPAGKRKGMTEGTRSNLWVQMREAVATIRPAYVIWENVRGAYSAYATSEVESEPGLLGDYGPTRPALRALGRVLGDLSDLGYDSRWVGVRASDVGAPHSRFRVFVVAQDSDVAARGERRLAASRQAEGGRSRADARGRGGAPAADTSGSAVGQQSASASAEETGQATGDGPRDHRGERPALDGRPAATDTDRDGLASIGRKLAIEPDANGGDGARVAWGPYEPAIRRWEHALGRVAPAPTEASVKGAQRLSPRFVEWMMGLPEGWVTDPAIGLKRTEQLKALGNGVVPQQAYHALELMSRTEVT